MNRLYVVAIIVGLLSCGATAMAAVPNVLTYQGMLTDTTGVPVTGSLSMTFTIYDDSSGGTSLWSETKTVEVSSGHFKTLLGSINPLDVAYFESDWRWLEITVAGETISPRSRLTTSPYAFRPGTIDGASGGTITGAITLVGSSAKDKLPGRQGDVIIDPEGAPNNSGVVRLIDGNGTETLTLQASEIPGNGPGSIIRLRDTDGNKTIMLDGDKPGDGGRIVLYNTVETATYVMGGTADGLGAYMTMNKVNGGDAIEIDAEDARAGYGPHMMMKDVNGDTAVYISSSASPYTSNVIGGEMALYEPSNVAGVRLGAASGEDRGGYLRLYNHNGKGTVRLFAEETPGSGGEILLYNASTTPVNTIQLIGDYGDGNGRIVTNVLEITGGSDLSEQFDVGSGNSQDQPEPGMVVVIDPDVPGQLIVSSKAYDPTVAGVISGAGDVNPGMLMGHQGTMADGQHPIALTGRVYCLVDASYGAIRPGDLLTTSETPGHAMKAIDRDRAYGAVIGKAMTGLEQCRGLILVLVNLQ